MLGIEFLSNVLFSKKNDIFNPKMHVFFTILGEKNTFFDKMKM